MSQQNDFAQTCRLTADAVKQASDWSANAENAARLGQGARSMHRTLRRAARRARKLAEAAERKPSVSVYGASQAGKSWMVSVLARPSGGRLITAFDGTDQQFDYLNEINPIGEGESTGLVTRFTVTRASAPTGYPVLLRLLSESDVVRVLMNTFRFDGDMSENPIEPEALQDHIAKYEGLAGTVGAPGLDEDGVAEIGDYAGTIFTGMIHGDRLEAFWQDAERIAPRLPREHRAAFLSILWGGYEELTRAYLDLGRALDQLGHTKEVHLRPESLSDRLNSIIDVATLKGLDDPSLNKMMEAHTPTGSKVEVPRAMICALGSELEIPIRDLPFPLMEQVDLLDFPGARSRDAKPMDQQLKQANPVKELFLRGKVALLFDRYVEDQGITSMLLCLPPSNNEVVGLSRMIENWISETSGEKPEERARTADNLIVVLTKFDEHLKERSGDIDPEAMFQKRIEISFEKYRNAGNNWVTAWTPGTPFRNSAWLRNPEYYCENIFEYQRSEDGEHKIEVGRRADATEYVAELKAGYDAAPLVGQMLSQPERAWASALAVDDGGVTHIRSMMDDACRPEVRDAQLRARLDDVAARVVASLRPYFASSDAAERKKEKGIAADKVIDVFYDLADANQLGAFHSAMMVGVDEIGDILQRVPGDIHIVSASETMGDVGTSAMPAAAQPSRRRRPARTGADESQVEHSEVTAPVAGPRRMTVVEFQANRAYELWDEKLQRLAERPDMAARFNISPQVMESLAAEILAAFRHRGGLEDLKKRLALVGDALSVARQALPAATICASVFNSFVSTFGASQLPLDQYPMSENADGEPRPAFAAKPVYHDLTTLSAQPSDTLGDYLTDWSFAVKAMFESNATAQSGVDADDPQNEALGEILGRLTGGA